MPIGLGSFTFVPNPQKPDRSIKVWTYQPPNLQPNAPIVVVMTGSERNGKLYRNTWAPYSDRDNFLLLVPEFPKNRYPGRAYNEGNILDRQGNLVPHNEWTFAIVEQLFDYAKEITGNQSQKYYLYGHSAGGQFVHRFVLFMPEARYQRAIAANPGYYTFLNPDIAYPYGLKGTSLQNGVSSTVFKRNFVMMLGEKDTTRNLPKTSQSDAQGLTRLERGTNYFKAAKAIAQTENAKFRWQLVKVPGVGHSDAGMVELAAKVLLSS